MRAGALSIDQFQSEMVSFVEGLEARSPELAASFAAAAPFPHVVIDGFLPPTIAGQVLAEFPDPGTSVWRNLKGYDQGGKQVLGNAQFLEGYSRLLIQELNSAGVLRALEQITGVGNLIADGKVLGGGLHQIQPGGRLNVHVDFSHHPEMRLNRRLNLLVYLNKDWREEYGGHFEMWDREVKHCVQRILPVFNRCVIFATSSFSYHGHPEPLTCPPHQTRKSLALP